MGKLFAAELTAKLDRFSAALLMLSSVLGEGRGIREGLAAQVAGVGPFPGVFARVDVAILPGEEGLATMVAGVAPLPAVGQLVQLERLVSGKGGRAGLT